MHERLLTAAIEYDKGDPKRIQHFIKVHSFARLIGKQEKLSDEMMKTLETAAILHDIGIHEGERLYGRNDGDDFRIMPCNLMDILIFLHRIGLCMLPGQNACPTAASKIL